MSAPPLPLRALERLPLFAQVLWYQYAHRAAQAPRQRREHGALALLNLTFGGLLAFGGTWPSWSLRLGGAGLLLFFGLAGAAIALWHHHETVVAQQFADDLLDVDCCTPHPKAGFPCIRPLLHSGFHQSRSGVWHTDVAPQEEK